MPAERDDEGRQVEDVDHGAHRSPEPCREHEDGGEGGQRRHAPALDRQRHEDSGESDHRSDRQIDAA
ncbi:hypothetical protein ABIF81_003923 [Bradyrhizobium daqingense]